MASPQTITMRQARLAWLARQHLSPVSAMQVPTLVGAVGWIALPQHTTGYLALHARAALTRRSTLDAMLSPRGSLVMVPGPRGLSWLTPRADAPLARAFAMADHTSREARVSAACGLTARDLATARAAVRDALSSPRTPAELRAALAQTLLRPLGAAARRVGFATLAGLVLRHLWIQGEVVRESIDGRLDGARIRYAVDPHPSVVPDAAEALGEIAPRWLAAHAPASLRDFAATFSIAVGRAASVLKRSDIVALKVDDLDDVMLVPEDFVVPSPTSSPQVHLVPLGDPISDARPTLKGLCPPTLAPAMTVRHLGPAALCLVDGEAVGSWTWDGARVVTHPVASINADVRERLEEAATATGAFIAQELGDAATRCMRISRGPLVVAGELSVEE